MQKAEVAGLRILVVEDEMLLALSLEDFLMDYGCTVAGPAQSVAEGLQWIEKEAIDGAILDVNLRGEMVFPLADALADRSIPFVYVTGYGKSLRACDEGRAVLQKPYDDQELLKIVSQWPHSFSRSR